MTRGLARIVLMVEWSPADGTAYRALARSASSPIMRPAVALRLRVDAGGWAEQRERGDLHGLRRPRRRSGPLRSWCSSGALAALKAKGGDCAAYGAVLERAYRSGQITIRPYMWRVGVQLASGEAHPNGDIFLAREIDSLNVGRRTFDDPRLVNGARGGAPGIQPRFTRSTAAPGDRADAPSRACRS
ncbi:MAG: hypothetical protein IPJ56_18240 [Gemmatimonadetes bacterium]|nr:hypothetical protein [Gemmatimonadota bacterium]